ncbi:hypothetical protein GCM10022226_16100 [Sphaerisporangium flaviroseum]|uniref:XRE family transcriptional regulator n=1 Tax=Sphaerisporangium flaviroseum TaxID=509199 RepID=A0ABP7HLZ7_9ACTN
MSGEGYRILRECRVRSERLRAMGLTFEQVAEVFGLFHDVSPLRLHRYAHGRTAAEVVAAYNDLDAAGTACLRESRLYDYETWPLRGKRPSARALGLFAQIYRTAARRLITDDTFSSYSARDRDLIDRTDHRHLASPQPRHASCASAARVSMDSAAVRTGGRGVPVFLARVPAPADCAALLRALGAEEADMRRRDMLFELALALGGAPALLLLRRLSPPEKDRLALIVGPSGRVDSQSVQIIEKLNVACRQLDDEFGPQSVLPVVDAQRGLVAELLKRESLLPGLRDRLVNTYAELSELAGYLCNDLMDYTQAGLRYKDALSAAHENADPTMIAYVHACLGWMALYQGKPGRALDHMFAAQGWAQRSESDVMKSAHAMGLAQVLARTGDVRESEHALARSVNLAGRMRDDTDPIYLYWWSDNAMQSRSADCMLAWGRADEALKSADRTLTSGITSKLLRGRTLLNSAEALIQKREIAAAAARIHMAAEITVGHSSARLAHSIRQAGSRLQPWADNKHVRALDDQLRSLSTLS